MTYNSKKIVLCDLQLFKQACLSINLAITGSIKFNLQGITYN